MVACPHCGLETKLYVPNTPLRGPPVAESPPSPGSVSQLPVEIKRRIKPFGIAALALGIISGLLYILINGSPVHITFNKSPVYVTNYVAAEQPFRQVEGKRFTAAYVTNYVAEDQSFRRAEGKRNSAVQATNRVDPQSSLPIDPRNRIVGGHVYRPDKSVLWSDLAYTIFWNALPKQAVVKTYATPAARCSIIKVADVGKASISCDVFKEVLDDGGTYGVFNVIGDEYVKTILIYHHPKHAEITTDAVIYSSHQLPGVTPFTVPFLSMRVENWNGGDGVVLEAYDCGLPDTVANRKKAGIQVPP